MKRYFKHKLENLIVVNNMITIHYFELGKDFVSNGEMHDFWELVYVDKGTIVCERDGKPQTVGEGSILFHKPGEFHIHRSDGKRPPKLFILSYECKSRAMHFFEGREIALEGRFVSMLYDVIEEARRTFDIAFTTPEDKGLKMLENPTLGGQQLIKNRLEIFLISLMRSMTETDRGNELFLRSEEFGSRSISDVVKLLEENLEGKISVTEICSRVGYSRAYVFKEFKRATGKTVMGYYTELKINRAKHLLRAGELTVKQIAEQLSFDTSNYFTKSFKRIVGVTPLAYRKRYSGKGGKNIGK